MNKLTAVLAAVVSVAVAQTILAGEAQPTISGTSLIFEVAEGGSDTYSSPIGNEYAKLIKRGKGTLTIKRADAAALDDFVGEIEVKDGRLCLPQLPNIGKPTKVTVSGGGTLDVSGCSNNGFLADAEVFLAGSGYDGTSGAFVRTFGTNYDSMLKKVTLTADTTVTIGARMGIASGRLDLGTYTLTKKGSGNFEIAKGGTIIGTGDIILQGSGTILEQSDLTGGTSDNHFYLNAQMDWWDSAYSKPIPWSLVGKVDNFCLYSGATAAKGFESGRLWSGPISSDAGMTFKAACGQKTSVATFSGAVNLGGGLTKAGPGSARFIGNSFAAQGVLTVSEGYLQFAPPTGTSITFNYAATSESAIQSSTEFVCPGSTVAFGGRFRGTACANGTIRLNGGQYTTGNAFFLGGDNARTHYLQQNGAQMKVLDNTARVGTASGCDLTMTLEGDSTLFRCGPAQKGLTFGFNRDANGQVVLNVRDGATFASGRFCPYQESNNSLALYVNVDGGSIKPLMAWGWNNTSSFDEKKAPTAFTLFEGGCVFDLTECYGNTPGEVSADGSVMFFPIVKPGTGYRVASVTIPAGHAILSERYDNVPPVRIGGSGVAASAYLDVDPVTRLVKGVVVTSKGWGYAETGTKVLVQNAAGTGDHEFDAVVASLPTDGWAGLTVRGAVPLSLACANTYLGPTTVEGGSIVFRHQEGRPLDSGLVIAKGATVNFNNTDQSSRPVPFVRGGGSISSVKAGTALPIERIEVTVAQLLADEFISVGGAVSFPENAVVKVLDPENLDVASFGRQRTIVSANALTLPASGLLLDVGEGADGKWKLRQVGSQIVLKPVFGLILVVE